MKLTNKWLPFFHKADYELLKSFSKNSDIIITRPNKCRGVVIMNKNDYIGKMEDILKDNTKFMEIGSPTFQPIFRIEDKINRLLKNFKDDGTITENSYKDLYCSGASYGVLY